MGTFLRVVNALLTTAVDGLLYPFRDLSPMVGLTVVSVLVSAAMLRVVRATSDQTRLAAVKRAIQACVFEVRLLNDDARAMFRAVGEMLRHNLTYLRLSLVPLLWMIVPLTLLVAQLQAHYGYSGLRAGRTAVVTARLAPFSGAPAANPPATLEAPPGIRVETPTVWIPSRREAVWRIAADQPGGYVLTVKMGNVSVTKSVIVSDEITRRSALRGDAGLVNQLLYPSEPPLPDDARIESIAITYPERSIRILGWEIHWLVIFFVLSTIFALALRSPFKVVL